MAMTATKASHSLRVTRRSGSRRLGVPSRGSARERLPHLTHPAWGDDGHAAPFPRALHRCLRRGSVAPRLLFIGNTGHLVISVDEAWVAAEFVDPMVEAGYQFSICVCEFNAGREFLSKYKKKSGRKPVLDRKQTFYSIDPTTIVRKGIKEIDMEQASLDSIDELTDLACAMVSEDLKLEDSAIDRRHYRLRMTEKVVEGRAYICRDADGRAMFKADMAVAGPEGGLLEGVSHPRNSGVTASPPEPCGPCAAICSVGTPCPSSPFMWTRRTRQPVEPTRRWAQGDRVLPLDAHGPGRLKPSSVRRLLLSGQPALGVPGRPCSPFPLP